MRLKSNKPILGLKECCEPYRCVFLEGNNGDSVVASSNGKVYKYPLGREVSITKEAWESLRNIQKDRPILPNIYSYDLFGDPIYAKS